jgi:hypothetical protein
MSFDSSKFSDPRGLNSSEDETRTQRFLTTISRDLGISSEIAANVRFSDTGTSIRFRRVRFRDGRNRCRRSGHL